MAKMILMISLRQVKSAGELNGEGGDCSTARAAEGQQELAYLPVKGMAAVVWSAAGGRVE